MGYRDFYRRDGFRSSTFLLIGIVVTDDSSPGTGLLHLLVFVVEIALQRWKLVKLRDLTTGHKPPIMALVESGRGCISHAGHYPPQQLESAFNAQEARD